jgi:hypothetical protein
MPDIVSEVGVTRVASGVLWIVGAASLKGDTTASRRVSLVARYPSIGRLPAAPIVTGGRVTLGAGVRFTADTSRDADCAVGSGASVIIAPGGAAQVPSGVRVDTAALARDSATYFLTGPQVAALASASGVVRVAGDTTIEGGSLDGILVVGGSLTLRGTFAGSGLIIVRGAIDAADAVVTMRGALLAYAAPPNVSTIFTDLSVEYAPCVVARAVRVALPPRAVRLRSWAELF